MHTVPIGIGWDWGRWEVGWMDGGYLSTGKLNGQCGDILWHWPVYYIVVSTVL